MTIRRYLDAHYEIGVCPYCSCRIEPVSEFRDAGSVREFWVSGLCQACQDKIYGLDGKPPPPDGLHPEVMLAPKELH